MRGQGSGGAAKRRGAAKAADKPTSFGFGGTRPRTLPGYDFEHAGEPDGFLVSAGRHLLGIWLLTAGQI